MDKKNMYAVIKIRKRPYYIWVLRLTWLAWLFFWVEVAIGSGQELEPRAFNISLLIFLVSLVIGLFLWFMGIRKNR
jgi:hypothetical protein